MLSDLERKVLMILWNLYRDTWSRPDLLKVSRLSGRTEQKVREAIKALRAAEYIEVRIGELRVLKVWEQQVPRTSSNLSIFID
ncbi:hypothetical protein SD70_02695 [Gordoniibacillus kamchatkensis]|uniref:Helix-turn-helix domain-containing protein n=1 Tax=Gordoniibacillus kamchatkensis TaxID=1590651 RepID=A0ABR5AMS7_9BACL|nr:hypothetical protein SD70_02695 [Paenibacillus sp. VKM B-2647]